MNPCRWWPGISSWWTVARAKWTLFPRRLWSLASCAIVFVGNETVMTSPPVKNGLSSCRSGDIIAIRHVSAASGGTVTRSCALR